MKNHTIAPASTGPTAEKRKAARQPAAAIRPAAASESAVPMPKNDIEGDVAALVGARDAVREQAQSRHVGGGDAGAEQRLEQRRRGEAVRDEAEAGGCGRGQPAAREIHAAPIDAVGERGPVRHRRDVAGEEHAADHAGLRVRQRPQVAQLRQQRGIGREAQHRQDVGAEKHDRGRIRGQGRN
jgi:hypothetical protein